MENILTDLTELKKRFLEIKALLDIDKKDAKAHELRIKMSAPDFWDDRDGAVKIAQEAEELFTESRVWNDFGRELKDLEEICRLALEENDETMFEDLSQKAANLANHLSKLEFAALFDGKYDKENAFLSIHAGTGGVDAQDWAEMLERMYLRFAEKKGFKAEVFDNSYGSEAGIKSAEMKISGPFAYGYLKSENGTHRLLRNSPFNADGLRQTSFALVEVIPEIKSDEAPIIKDEEIRIDVFRSSGPGGQSVNTTDSAVRITHIPTGIVVSCQNERSQHQNKENAFKILQSKLTLLALAKKEEEEKSLKGGQQKAEWGAQIRSYCLYGNKYVKDHRTEAESSNVDAVLDGDIEQFMEAYLRRKRKN